MKNLTVGRDVACGITSRGRVICWGVLERRYYGNGNQTGAEICRGEGVDELPNNAPPPLAVALSANSQSAAVWMLGEDQRIRVREERPQEEISGGHIDVPRRWSLTFIDLGPPGGDARQIGTGDELDQAGFFPFGNGCVLHVRGNVTCKFGFPVDWGKQRRWRRAYKHGCALVGASRVACWGYNRFGQAPASIGLPAPAKEIAVGQDQGCALLVDGRVACWGANAGGEMGPPLTPCKAGCSYQYCDGLPHIVPGLRNISRLRAGGATTCAITRDGGLLCWDTAVDASDRCDFHPG
jgi:hypothetical protein